LIAFGFLRFDIDCMTFCLLLSVGFLVPDQLSSADQAQEKSRVEMRRGGLGLRFHIPLVEPDVRL